MCFLSGKLVVKMSKTSVSLKRHLRHPFLHVFVLEDYEGFLTLPQNNP